MTRVSKFITRRMVGAYDAGSASNRARERRWELFGDTFPEIKEQVVLDIGGDARAWRTSVVRPRHVYLVNIFGQKVTEPWMTSIQADACDSSADLPDADIVYSNSVIEHVGGHYRRVQMAENVRARAAHYWIQTPYRYFPVEPHFLAPGVQHLPVSLRARIVRRWPVGNYHHVTERADAFRRVTEIELIGRSEMAFYFPDAEIHKERFAGLTKSLIAIKA